MPIQFFLHTSGQNDFSGRIRVRGQFRVRSDSIASGRYSESPPTFAETSDGRVLIANGMQPMLVWDGRDYQASEAGVPAPTDAMTLSSLGSGSITGSYTAYQRWLDEDGNPSNLSEISNTLVVTDVSTIVYSGVETPTDQRITTRQLLRSTNGQGGTYFVDIETNDLGQTTFQSTKTDTELMAEEAVTLFSAEGEDLANRFGIPPNHKTNIVHHNNRIWAAGERDYKTGAVEVTFGSATVAGVGTAWTAALEGRLLHVVGADDSYTIDAVDVSAQTVTLTETYKGATDLFARYAIRPRATEGRLIYYSGLGLSQSWSATDALAVKDDGDKITALFEMGPYLFIAEDFHLYKMLHKSDPAIDGAIFQTLRRGALNQRCVVIVDDSAYILDLRGIYSFSGGEEIELISQQIHDVFRNDAGESKINWTGRDFFHGAHYPSQETIRFFVSLSGTKYPRHALCYHYRLKRWWIEEFNRHMASSASVIFGIPQTVVGSSAYQTFVLESGTLDQADAEAGAVRGYVTTATPFTISDSAAVFAASGLVGTPLAIVGGRGKGQIRRIIAKSGTTLTVDRPWLVLPSISGDDRSTYQIGGIFWDWKSGWFRTIDLDTSHMQGTEVLFGPTAAAATFDFRQFFDHSDTPDNMGIDNDTDGVQTTTGDPDTIVDMAYRYDSDGRRIDSGFAMMPRANFTERWTHSPSIVSYELRGFTNADTVRIYEMTVWGVLGSRGE